MKTYAKYEFTELPEIIKEIENASVVTVGRLTKEQGTYDEKGNELTPPVISDKIAVDIIYKGEPLEELEPNRIYPETPDHTIAGMEELYFETL